MVSRVSLSVALLLEGSDLLHPSGGCHRGGIFQHALALDATVPVTLKVTCPPAGRFTVALMLPDPGQGGGRHVTLPEAGHVQVTFVRVPGSVSVTVAPVTADGPLFVTTRL